MNWPVLAFMRTTYGHTLRVSPQKVDREIQCHRLEILFSHYKNHASAYSLEYFQHDLSIDLRLSIDSENPDA